MTLLKAPHSSRNAGRVPFLFINALFLWAEKLNKLFLQELPYLKPDLLAGNTFLDSPRDVGAIGRTLFLLDFTI